MQHAVLLDLEAKTLDLASQRRIGPRAVGRTGYLSRPQKIEVLRNLGWGAIRWWRNAPRHRHRHWAHSLYDILALHARGHEKRGDPEIRVRLRGDEYLGRPRRHSAAAGRKQQRAGRAQP